MISPMHLKAFFATILLNNAAKSLDSLGNTLGVLGGRAHACARAWASEKLRTTKFGTCCVPYHETLVRASGKDLAQGQVSLVDPI